MEYEKRIVTDGRASLSNLGHRSRGPLKKKKKYLKCPTPKLVQHLEEVGKRL